MIIYIHGADTFRSRQYLKDQVAKFKTARDPQGYNTVFLDAAREEPGRILSEISAAPFLAEKRMVVLENVLLNKDKDFLGDLIERVHSCHSKRSEEFKQNKRVDPSPPKADQDDKSKNDDKTAKRSIPENNVVVFWQGEETGKTKEAKELDELLAKEKFAYKFEPLGDAELKGFIIGEVKKRGGKINNFALNYLAQNTGTDMWRLNSLLDQLCAYKSNNIILTHPSAGKDTDSSSASQRTQNDSEITLADVQLFLEEKVDDNIFSLVDAIVNGNKKQAFKLLAQQRRVGAEEPQIFGMIVWQFRMLISIRDLTDREDGLTSDAIAKRLGMKPYPVRKSLPIAKRYPLSRLKEIYRDLLEIDIKTKTGAGEPELLLDVFVGKV